MRRISTNILFSFLGEILLFGLSFLLNVLIARYLGPAGKGRFWIIWFIAALFSLIFSMRFSRSVTYHLSKNQDMLGEIILYGLFIGIITVSCIAIVMTLFSSILYKTLLKNITTSYSILVLVCFSRYLWTLIVSTIEGLLMFKEKSFFMGGSYLLKLILVLLALLIFKLDFDGLILFMGSIETVVYSSIIIFLLGKAQYFRVSLSSLVGMLKYSLGSFPGFLADTVTLRIDAVFLNYFSGPAEVGIYTVAVSLASMLLYVPAAARSVLMPYVARFSDKEMTAKLSRCLIIIISVLALALLPLVWAAVIPIYGEEFFFSRILFVILLPGSVFWGAYVLIASDIEGRGLPWRVSKVSMISALIAVVLDLILIPILNSTGAAVVSSITYGISTLLLTHSYKRMTGVNMGQLFVPKMEDLYTLSETSRYLIAKTKEILSPIFCARKPQV